MELHMNPFKGRHFQRDIILWAVRWYCKYGISYRELQEMLAERGVNVDHSTIYRWVQRYAPEMEKRLRWYWRNPSDLCPWHMDETYVKVNGRWAYLYRAVDSRGRTVDFYLSSRRNSKAAYRFLGKFLKNRSRRQSAIIPTLEALRRSVRASLPTDRDNVFLSATPKCARFNLKTTATIKGLVTNRATIFNGDRLAPRWD
jgi:IS6 family transposase